MWLLKHGRKQYLLLLLLFSLSLPSVLFLFRPGFFASDDGEWMIIRFSAFHQAFRDGQFPVRWLGRLNHEYGYPVANFLYPGFMYLAEVPKLVGFGFVDSVKIIFAASMLASFLFCFLWLVRLFRPWSASMGALFYLYAPYHLYTLYKRGSVGEVLALAVLPFILFSIERRSMASTALGIGLLVLSHNTLAILFFPLMVGYMLVRKTQPIHELLASVFLGLSLASFFWIPALYDLQYTKFSQTLVSNWQDHFAGWPLTWLHVALAVGVLWVISSSRRLAIFFLIVSGIGTLLSHPLSSLVWQTLPSSYLQFPFRLLSLAIVSGAFLSAYILDRTEKKKRILVGAVLLVALFSSAFPYARPKALLNKGDGFYATNEDSTTVRNEYMPKWVEVIPVERPKQKVEIVGGRGVIAVNHLKTNSLGLTANLELAGTGTVRVNTVYFPGWQAFVNGKKAPISYTNKKGAMEVNVIEGENTVLFTFGETPVRLASNGISLIALTIILILFLPRRRVFLQSRA